MANRILDHKIEMHTQRLLVKLSTQGVSHLKRPSTATMKLKMAQLELLLAHTHLTAETRREAFHSEHASDRSPHPTSFIPSFPARSLTSSAFSAETPLACPRGEERRCKKTVAGGRRFSELPNAGTSPLSTQGIAKLGPHGSAHERSET